MGCWINGAWYHQDIVAAWMKGAVSVRLLSCASPCSVQQCWYSARSCSGIHISIEISTFTFSELYVSRIIVQCLQGTEIFGVLKVISVQAMEILYD